MRLRQIGNAWSERENKERQRERGVIFSGVQWPWKMLVGFITASLWGLFTLLSEWPSLNGTPKVQAVTTASIYHAEVSLSKTPNFSLLQTPVLSVSLTSDLPVLGVKTGDFPYWDQQDLTWQFIITVKNTADYKSYFKSLSNISLFIKLSNLLCS